ncbi:DUF4258 domain-containing protein [Nonlabens ponticola]|uniref:DUF4258 domain-containing protein n=1 Tax=Nonlabens ponticola TaxID=2496866 RepID=A0A3S9MZA2_9FLAO|nr:DUF4258 domain-containing protein [Nonlabens ponticola]AZQ44422.1 DUF4258 domain-containing protein [Nonlabens ponticola]
MNFVKRLGYYMGGFAIGLVFLVFFLTGKRAQCNWFPEDRVMADFKRKSITLSPEVRELLKNQELDTLTIQMILLYGDVDFSKSNTDTVPCSFYYVNGRKEMEKTALRVRNCDKILRVEEVIYEKEN